MKQLPKTLLCDRFPNNFLGNQILPVTAPELAYLAYVINFGSGKLNYNSLQWPLRPLKPPESVLRGWSKVYTEYEIIKKSDIKMSHSSVKIIKFLYNLFKLVIKSNFFDLSKLPSLLMLSFKLSRPMSRLNRAQSSIS